jgi:cytochrome P450
MPKTLVTASAADSVRTVRDVLLPVVAQGAILRRTRISRLADRISADDRSMRRVRTLRNRYGDGPLLLRIPGRRVALLLRPSDVRRVLDQTPEPFSAATSEKVGALRHFQPHAVLVSDPALRPARRELNEVALDTHQPVHRHGAAMLDVITEELDTLHGTLGWADFREVWSRIVRRIVLGDESRHDTTLTEQLDELRADANWAQFRRRDHALRRSFQGRIDQYVAAAEPGSLVHDLPSAAADLDPGGQVPHWLFAFDAAGIALWRLLAVLAAQPARAATIAEEASHPQQSPLLAQAGAAIQESVRLWPTTLVVLRQARSETEWDGRIAPAGTEFAIVSSIFHRDDHALEYANRFEPGIWLDGRSEGAWPLIPFSAGPAICPGRNLVLLTTSAATSHVVADFELDVDPTTRQKLSDDMPATFDHTTPRIAFWPKAP